MRAITTTVEVGPDRVLTVQLPPEVPPGRHEVVVVLNGATVAPAAQLSPPHPVGLADPDASLGPWPRHDSVAWPADLSLRREDLYGDDGR